MKPITQIFYLLFAVLSMLFTTCKESEIYPEVPAIKFKDAYVLFDSFDVAQYVVLTISYKDGDGDIGLEDGDTLYPFNFIPDPQNPKKNINPYYDNMVVEYFDLIDGKYLPAVKDFSTDTLRPTFRIPNLTPEGKHKAIRGDIEVKMFPSPYTISSDTIKLKVKIYDRALHESNVVETPDIYLFRKE